MHSVQESLKVYPVMGRQDGKYCSRMGFGMIDTIHRHNGWMFFWESKAEQAESRLLH
jgi:hypothetical protein